MIRPQYHLRPSKEGLLAWNVGRLIELSEGLRIQHVALNQIREVDQNHWFFLDGQVPSPRSILDHINLIEDADLSFPIVLDSDGRLMDGMHRVCKAIRQGHTHIKARQFSETPTPDFVGLRAEDLRYD